MSLLSKKDNATLTDYARVQKLVRIGRRAICKADWLTGPELTTYYAECASPADIAHRDADVAKARSRAQAATDEILEIARHTDDFDLRRRARAV